MTLYTCQRLTSFVAAIFRSFRALLPPFSFPFVPLILYSLNLTFFFLFLVLFSLIRFTLASPNISSLHSFYVYSCKILSLFCFLSYSIIVFFLPHFLAFSLFFFIFISVSLFFFVYFFQDVCLFSFCLFLFSFILSFCLEVCLPFSFSLFI